MANDPQAPVQDPELEKYAAPDDELEKYAAPPPSQPSWGDRAAQAWGMAKQIPGLAKRGLEGLDRGFTKATNALGLGEGFLFGGSGEAGGTASAVTPGDVARSFTYPVAEAGGELAAPYVSKAASKLFPSWGKEELPSLFDMTKEAVARRDASWIPTRMPSVAEVPPELGSPENPGLMSKI